MGLDASDATREQYPFEFALRFTYRLRGGVLSVEQRFENRGDGAMPLRPGLHPYFFVPEATKAGARIDTDATRAYDNTAGREVSVTLPIALSNREVDLFLLDHLPRSTALHRPGLPGVHIGFGDDQEVLVVWTLPGRDFVCVEPWRARPGALDDRTSIPPSGFACTALTLALRGAEE